MAQFASADELAAFLRVPAFDAPGIVAANLCLAGASAAIQRYTGQQIELVTDDVQKLQGTWSKELELPQWPVVSVSDVRINSGVVAPGTWFLTSNGRLYRGYLPIFNGPDDWGGDLFLTSWLGPISTVQVTYTHGWETIPDDVKLVTLRVAARAMGNPTAATQEHIGAYSVSYAPGTATLTEADEKDLAWVRNHL